MFFPLKDVNPTRRRSWVTLLLIGINGLVFVLGLTGPFAAQRLTAELGLVPARILAGGGGPTPDWLTAFTSMFLHADLLHLGGNLLYLWIFGNNVEDVLGPVRYVVFFLAAGLGGHVAHVLTDPASTVPTIGASGAISGVLAAYLLRFPGARIVSLVFLGFFIRLVQVPAGVVIGFWFLVQAVSGMASIGSGAAGGGGIAWFEHLGGFAAGLLLFPLLGGLRGRPHGGSRR